MQDKYRTTTGYHARTPSRKINHGYLVDRDGFSYDESFEIQGQLDPIFEGTIRLSADVFFGSIHIQYL